MGSMIAGIIAAIAVIPFVGIVVFLVLEALGVIAWLVD